MTTHCLDWAFGSSSGFLEAVLMPLDLGGNWHNGWTLTNGRPETRDHLCLSCFPPPALPPPQDCSKCNCFCIVPLEMSAQDWATNVFAVKLCLAWSWTSLWWLFLLPCISSLFPLGFRPSVNITTFCLRSCFLRNPGQDSGTWSALRKQTFRIEFWAPIYGGKLGVTHP